MTLLGIGSAALRLAQYLKEFVSLRTTTVRDVAKYDSVLWFGDMPQEPDCCSPAWTENHEPGIPWLEVKKQQFEKAPPPPEIAVPWLDKKALARATPIIPALRSTILLPDVDAEHADGEEPPLIEHSIRDHPEVQQAYDHYRGMWEAWSAEFRRREAIQAIYAALFSLHTQVRKQGEIIEVVLGLGLLDWRQKVNGGVVRIRRHSVVARAELEFEPSKGLIRVVPPNDGARLQIEDDMLDAQFRPDRVHYATVAAQLKEIGDEVWDKALMFTSLKIWAGALSASSKWNPGLGAASATENDPVMSFAPALIVRRRAQTGMVRIYQTLIEQLSDETAQIPPGWDELTTDERADPSHNVEEQSKEPDAITEVYFPLPANREQRQIVEAIARERGVLVQGPPGTGKSHTIANLICHLLATGKRVLITAETSRALQVLKEKLPAEVQPLCISLLGQGGDALAELNKAVQGITTRQASYTPGAYDKRIAEVDHELDLARRQLAKTDGEIRSLREEETCPHQIANGVYSGSASAIAERVANESIHYAWLKLPPDSQETPPLNNSDVIQWLEILRRYTEVEISESRLRIPPISEIADPSKFAEAVATEQSASSLMAQTQQLRTHKAYASISALSAEARDSLRSDIHDIEVQRLTLAHTRGKWQQGATHDLVEGQRARWNALLAQSQKELTKAEYLLEQVGSRQVTLLKTHDARRVRADAETALGHLSRGGKWKLLGILTPKALVGCDYLRRDVLVDGKPASDGNALQIVCDNIELEFVLADLHSIWRAVGAPPVSGDRRMRVAQFKERLASLQQLIDFANDCHQLAHTMRAAMPPIPEPEWVNGQASEYIQLLDSAATEQRARKTTQIVDSTLLDIQILSTLPDAHPVCKAICTAIEARDVNAYALAYEHAKSVAATREDQQLRDSIKATLVSFAPGLAEYVETSIDEPAWTERLSLWEQTWHWCIADDWLHRRSNVGYQQKLWTRRYEIDAEIRQLLAEAASLRAWTHFFGRLLPRESAALKGWRETVKAMGKGTGQSAKLARLREDARKYMDVCRDAIPVWIMPRYLVAEMIDPAPNRYDIVIVDEASQLGIESLFLFYISKKMVVVGDDQQISPYGIGIDNDAIAGLQDQYLEGMPHQGSLSAQSSLYGNAKIRFSKNVVLREHFRCMPEIIQFSNDLCYASNGTPLDPLRAYPANRLQPLVRRHIVDGYRSGSSQNAQNVPEADAIVAQIASCIDDPRYARATMGVISLQGDAQAKLIERKLLEHLDPEVIEAKRLICGDAYAFQGDERDVIFLSMVAAPGEKRIGVLSTESARQRFNVAVSRARDQLWLFHSVTLDVLSDACMRHRLLSYMLNPSRTISSEEEQHFDSEFERAVFRLVTERGFHVRTQVCIGDPVNHRYRIDLVVEGMQGRLAVECDGERWHGPERYEHDMARQRDLERAGWEFVRIRGGDFYRDRDIAMHPVWAELDRLGIKPGGIDEVAAAPPPPMRPDTFTQSNARIGLPDGNEPPGADDDSEAIPPPLETDTPATWKSTSDTPEPESQTRAPEQTPPHPSEHPVPTASPVSRPVAINVDDNRDFGARAGYNSFEGEPGPDPRNIDSSKVCVALRRVIEVEGPMIAKRAYDIYLRGCGIQRMGGELKKLMNKALQHAIRNGDVFAEDELGNGGLIYSVVRTKDAPIILVRERGPREFEEIPPSELQLVARRLARDHGLDPGSDAHLREVLEFFELKRLTVQVATTLKDVLSRKYPYVDKTFEREA